MATTQPQLPPSLQISTPGDTMEVTSDYGHPLEDEGIDIDIDFTNDEQDEDHVLEDVDADTGYEDVNDDLMIDDDESSYHMDDAVDEGNRSDTEYVQMENAHDIDEQSPQDVEIVQEDYLDIALVDETQDANSTIGWDESDELTETQATDAQDLVHETESSMVRDQEHNDNTESKWERDYVREDAKNVQEADDSDQAFREQPDIVSSNNHDIQHAQLEFEDEIATKARSESLGTQIVLDHVSEADEANQNTTTAQVSSESEVHGPLDSSANVNGSEEKPLEVLVLYRGIEYSLIGAPDNHDSDSYFFKDDALTKSNLCTFFTGLRDILYNDLPEYHELVISIAELSIEISETIAGQFDVTFAQLVQLYADLKKNDSPSINSALLIRLSTRINPLKRVTALYTHLAEGRGLSEHLHWGEDSFDDEEQVQRVEDNDRSEDEKGEVENIYNENVTHAGVNDEQVSETVKEQPDPNKTGSHDIEGKERTQSVGDETSDIYDVELYSAKAGKDPGDLSQNAEDDLIDYEEDEEEDLEQLTEEASLNEQGDSPSVTSSSNDKSQAEPLTAVPKDSDIGILGKDGNMHNLAGQAIMLHDDRVQDESVPNDVNKERTLTTNLFNENAAVSTCNKQTGVELGLEMPKTKSDVLHETDSISQTVIEDEIGYEDELDETPESALLDDENQGHVLDVRDDEIDFDEEDYQEEGEDDISAAAEPTSIASSPASNDKRSHAELEEAGGLTGEHDTKRVRY